MKDLREELVFVVGVAAMVFAALAFDWRAALFVVGLLLWVGTR